MNDRKRLVTTLWLASSLTLLTSVLVAPPQTTRLVTVSFRLDCLERDFALPAGLPTTCLNAAMATDAVQHMNAIAPENDEQDRADFLNEPRVSFLIPSSFRKVPNFHSIAPLSILSLYPLRC